MIIAFRTLFYLTFVLFISLSASAIPTAKKQTNAVLAGRGSRIAEIFNLNNVNPRCRSQCQPASDIASACQTDECVCNNKHNEVTSACLSCGAQVADSFLEKEVAASNTIAFFLDVCSQPVDSSSNQNATSTDDTAITNLSIAPAPTSPPTPPSINIQSDSLTQSTGTLTNAINIPSATSIDSTRETQAVANVQGDPAEKNGMTRSATVNIWTAVAVTFSAVLTQL